MEPGCQHVEQAVSSFSEPKIARAVGNHAYENVGAEIKAIEGLEGGKKLRDRTRLTDSYPPIQFTGETKGTPNLTRYHSGYPHHVSRAAHLTSVPSDGASRHPGILLRNATNAGLSRLGLSERPGTVELPHQIPAAPPLIMGNADEVGPAIFCCGATLCAKLTANCSEDSSSLPQLCRSH